jgi:hypothetical protein
MIASRSGRLSCATAQAPPYQACGDGLLLGHDGRQFFENLNGRVARDPWRYVISLRALTSTMDLPVLCLGADNNSIVDFRYTSRPVGSFSLVAFGPRAHGPLQDCLAPIALDRNAAGVDSGCSP